MTTIYEFMSKNPFLTFFSLIVLVSGISGIVWMVSSIIGDIFFRLPNRVLRHFSIKKHGWPPLHCDADGDLTEYYDDDEENTEQAGARDCSDKAPRNP